MPSTNMLKLMKVNLKCPLLKLQNSIFSKGVHSVCSHPVTHPSFSVSLLINTIAVLVHHLIVIVIH